MLVAQRKHLASRPARATSTTTTASAPTSASSPRATPQNHRVLVKSPQMSPPRTAPSRTHANTATTTPSRDRLPTRPTTSPVRAGRKALVSVTSKHVSPSKDKSSALAQKGKSPSATERSKIHYMTMDELHAAYSFEYKVGSGNWASVWKVTYKAPNGGKVIKAVKMVDREDGRSARQRSESLMREYKCLRSIPAQQPWHPSIINFDDLILTSRYLCLVMPFYEHPMQVCVPLSTCRNFFEKLASAVAWLHRHYITHNDIKLVNTVVRVSDEDWDGTPVIVDFGFSTMHHPWRGTNFITNDTWGTPEYLSPERVAGRPHDERLSDIWALGVTFFEIATGRTPFERQEETFITEDTKTEYYRRVAAGEWIIDDHTPWELEDLCRCMLELEPNHRARLDEIVQHEFFSPHALDSDAAVSEQESSHASRQALHRDVDTSFLAYEKQDDDVDFSAHAQHRRPFPTPRRQQGHETPPAPASSPRKLAVKDSSRAETTDSPWLQPLPATPSHIVKHPCDKPLQSLPSSPLRQALQNAASRANKAPPVKVAPDGAPKSIERELFGSTIGNHGSLCSPARPAETPSLSPVKYGHSGRGSSQAAQCGPNQAPRPAHILTPARTPVSISIDDANVSESESESESESDVSSSSSDDDDRDGNDDEVARIGNHGARVSRSSSTVSSEDAASLIDLDSPEAQILSSPPPTASTSASERSAATMHSSTSADTAPPGYTSSLGQQETAASVGGLASRENSRHASLTSSIVASAESAHASPSFTNTRDEEPTIRRKVEPSDKPNTAHETPPAPILAQQQPSKFIDMAVQTDQPETLGASTQVDMQTLAKTLDSVHLMAFHLLATVQQARKLLLSGSMPDTGEGDESVSAHAEAVQLVEQSLLAGNTSMASLSAGNASFCSDVLPGQPMTSTPSRRKRKEPDLAATPSASSISTSRMAVRDRVSTSTFGTPTKLNASRQIASPIDDELIADAVISAAERKSLEDVSLANAARAQQKLEREISAMHLRSRSLFSVLDDINAATNAPSSAAAALKASAASGITGHESDMGSNTTILLHSNIQHQGPTLKYRPASKQTDFHQVEAHDKENVPSIANSPPYPAAGLSPGFGPSTGTGLLQRRVSHLRSQRKKRQPPTINTELQPHGRSFSVSSLLNFSAHITPTSPISSINSRAGSPTQPITPSSSTVSGKTGLLWKKLKGGGGAVNRSG